jgi:hypothetical protein
MEDWIIPSITEFQTEESSIDLMLVGISLALSIPVIVFAVYYMKVKKH